MIIDDNGERCFVNEDDERTAFCLDSQLENTCGKVLTGKEFRQALAKKSKKESKPKRVRTSVISAVTNTLEKAKPGHKKAVNGTEPKSRGRPKRS